MNGRRFCPLVLAVVVLLSCATGSWGQVATQTYFLWDTYGGTFHDAEKFPNNTNDDLMCWAATASNILDWGGWDAPGFTGDQAMFQHFQDHWTDYGSFPDRAWLWWFDGTLPTDPTALPNPWSSVDVPNGGNFWSDEGPNFSDYYREMHGSAGDLMPFIDDCLHDSYGVGIQVVSPDVWPWTQNHEITLWGFDFHVDPSTGNTIYDAIHVTDSDDDQGNLTPLLVNYPITWDATNSHWDLGGGYSGWHILDAMALKPAPETNWQYLFRYDYSDGGDSYYGYLYAPARAGYYVGQVVEHLDEAGGVGKYTILGADREVNGEYAAQAAQNYVELIFYHDKESDSSFDRSQMMGGFGTAGLGSEHGFIKGYLSDFFFGYDSQDPGPGRPTIFEADPLEEWHYEYSYNFDSTVDRYEGSFWVSHGTDLSGYLNPVNHDEHGDPGYYKLKEMSHDWSWDSSKFNQVTVTSYYNYENVTSYTPVSVDGSEFFGHDGLGTERGYILPHAIDTYYFGKKPVEDPVEQGKLLWPDPHYEADLLAIYSYKMTNSIAGDIYRGTVTADEGDYQAGMTIPLGEYGNLGSYEIISQDGYTNDPSRYGQVVVTSYFDGQSQRLFGINQLLSGQVGKFLKSEFGRLLLMDTATYKFGWIDGELQQADPYWRYDFTCYYENGAGDSFSGTFYDHRLYEVGDQVYAFTDEHSQPGYYVINAVEAVDAGMDGQVFVNTYHDSDLESDITYTVGDPLHPLLTASPAGTNYPGSEAGHIILGWVPEYAFGKGQDGKFYEADLVAYAYDYTFAFSNGDFYRGTVYAEPEKGYYSPARGYYSDFQPAQVENGMTGTYSTSNMTPGFDVGLAGQVTVASYYDVEMKRAYVPTYFEGSNYLGSECGFIVTNRPPDGPPFDQLPPGILKKFFGYDGIHSFIYEADVEQDKKDKEETTYTAQVAMNVTEPLVSYQPADEEKSKSKKAK